MSPAARASATYTNSVCDIVIHTSGTSNRTETQFVRAASGLGIGRQLLGYLKALVDG